MNIEKEINDLSAQCLALSSIVSFVLAQMLIAEPNLRSAIAAGFDDAASFVENVAIKYGKTASPQHTVKAIRIVEELRAATLGDHDKPRHGV